MMQLELNELLILILHEPESSKSDTRSGFKRNEKIVKKNLLKEVDTK